MEHLLPDTTVDTLLHLRHRHVPLRLTPALDTLKQGTRTIILAETCCKHIIEMQMRIDIRRHHQMSLDIDGLTVLATQTVVLARTQHDLTDHTILHINRVQILRTL